MRFSLFFKIFFLTTLMSGCESNTSFNDEDLKNVKIIFQDKSRKYEFPIWNLINGPISDAIYHTGQLVSFRRTSGNPIPKGVNVFLGAKN